MPNHLLESSEINLLRDLRKLEGGWLSNDTYIDFLVLYPQIRKMIFANEAAIQDVFGVSAQEFLDSLSKKRPVTNFNPDNRLGKPRPRWTQSQISRLQRVRGL